MVRRQTFIALRARRTALGIARAVMYGPPMEVERPPVPDTATPAPPPRVYESDDPPPAVERWLDRAALMFVVIIAVGGCIALVVAVWVG